MTASQNMPMGTSSPSGAPAPEAGNANQDRVIATLIAYRRIFPALPITVVLILTLPFSIPIIIIYILFLRSKTSVSLTRGAIILRDEPDTFSRFMSGRGGLHGVFPLQHVTGVEYSNSGPAGCMWLFLLSLIGGGIYIGMSDFEGAEIGYFMAAFALFLLFIILLLGAQSAVTIFMANRQPIQLTTRERGEVETLYNAYYNIKFNNFY